MQLKYGIMWQRRTRPRRLRTMSRVTAARTHRDSDPTGKSPQLGMPAEGLHGTLALCGWLHTALQASWVCVTYVPTGGISHM